MIRVLGVGIVRAVSTSAIVSLQNGSKYTLILGSLRNFLEVLGILGYVRVVFKTPSTPRIKISCLELKKSQRARYIVFLHVLRGQLFALRAAIVHKKPCSVFVNDIFLGLLIMSLVNFVLPKFDNIEMQVFKY